MKILVSNIIGIKCLSNFLENKINENSKVLFIPWAFPKEINYDEFCNDYFQIGGKRYNKYYDVLKQFGIKSNNIEISNPYKNENIEKQIINSDVVIITGGNPEMLYKKMKEKNLDKILEKYTGILIGESAGALIQFEKYFIMADNNYYKCFSYYNGFDIIPNDFLIDVHSKLDDLKYMKKLEEVSKSNNKKIYAIDNYSAIVYDEKTNKVKTFENVKIIGDKKSNRANIK